MYSVSWTKNYDNKSKKERIMIILEWKDKQNFFFYITEGTVCWTVRSYKGMKMQGMMKLIYT